MDAIEKRARAVETLARALADEYQDDSLAREVVVSLKAGQLELLNTRIAIRAIIAALTPPEGFVLVPVEPTREMVECAVYAQEPSVGSPAGGSNNANRLRRKAKRIWAAMLNASGKS